MYTSTIDNFNKQTSAAPKVGDKRKQLTRSQPFSFETSKRAKIMEDPEVPQLSRKDEYKPLCELVKESFALRPDDIQRDINNLESMLFATGSESQ